MGKKDHSWLNSGKYWWKLKLAGFYHPLWKHGERRLHALDARHMDCAHVHDTKQVNESSHNTQTNEWHARTQKMRAGGVYPTPISLHLQQPLEKSVSRAQAGWVNVSAVPPRRMVWPVIFIFSPTHASNPCMLLNRDDIQRVQIIIATVPNERHRSYFAFKEERHELFLHSYWRF